jgi:peptidoglycan hydrolase-like protein with peptidoglycan-binding domain
VKLFGSVGRSATNSPGDVRFVQRLLNDWLAIRGGTILKVDGLAGPKTVGAVELFQRLSGCVTDGRVDSTGQTLRRLVNGCIERLAKNMVRFPMYGSTKAICSEVEAIQIVEEAMKRLSH